MYYVELKDGKIKGVYTKEVHGEKLCNDLYKNDGLILDEEIWQYVLAFGEQWRRAYSNTEEGIEDLKREIPEPYLSTILNLWVNK
ncbi:MAG: hypothetical protein ACLSV2_04645 [Clostridium sp.]